ncbi:type IV pilus assembly protein PilV [Rugamonas rubra]|uniref:Type IV pilus assembly protein PilV n=2 Tax=Rugamonas rubra TaxID=758825 RepID=A0A1I4IS10_9BURK|nr:type IV pilus assembly protein PilV [Rugamonas rubra]
MNAAMPSATPGASPAATPRQGRRAAQRGVALLEAMLAIVILGIGLLGTVGLQARAYSALSDASMRAEATMAVEKLLGVMSNDVANIPNYALAEGAVPNAALAPWLAETRGYIPGARIAVAVTAELRRFRVDATIRWTRKAGGVENQHQITSYISN